MSELNNIATDYLIAAPQLLVPFVPSAPVSQASNTLVLATVTYAKHLRPLSYVVISLSTVSLLSQSPSPGTTSPVATLLRPSCTSQLQPQ